MDLSRARSLRNVVAVIGVGLFACALPAACSDEPTCSPGGRTEGAAEETLTLLRFRREDVEAGTSVRYVIAP
jgi:hypothetical protein